MARALQYVAALWLFGALLAAQQGFPPYGAAPPDAPQDQTDSADLEHGVARVSFLGGDVNLQRGDSSDLVAAVVNAPLLSRDRLQTATNSSAEVQLDGSTVVRLAQNTDVGFADLQFGHARLQFGTGTILFRILRETQLQTEIETPSVAIHPLGAADLRVSVFENGTTSVTVRAGAADIFGPGGTQRLEAPRSVLVRANGSGPEFQESYPPPHDSLDDWSASRDNQLLASTSYQYTGGDMAGVADLDANGAWVSSQYGPAWSPRVPAAGWSPYSDGQWVNEPYYGWTWVDSEPWGWAPSHYGRWFWNGGRGWCWWPGARGIRPAWGPAYVGFFGWNRGGAGLGWVALAPYEGFHSWWGRGAFRGGYGGFDSFRGGVMGSYRNAAYHGAVGTTYAGFGGWRGHFTSVSREVLVGGTPIHGQLPVSAAAYRFRFVDRAAFANPRLAGAAGRSYFQAPRSGFSASRPGFGSPGITPSVNAGAGGVRTAPPYRPPTTIPSSGAGWHRFGDPRGPAAYRQSFSSGQEGSGSSGSGRQGSAPGESGWHQFGQPERARPSAPPAYRNFGSPQNSYRPAPSSPPPSRNFSGSGNAGGGQARGGGGRQSNSGGPHGGDHSGGGGNSSNRHR